MSQEMFYTSAPKGLQPGSRGFCTVAATRGMSPALLEKLESLSGYRPLFPPHDARAALNPVTFAHVRVTVGGRVFPVLSRVGPAGLDYTERPNKFAHHVVLEVGELPAAGPAWLLSQPGFMEARWDGQVGFLPAGRTPPDGSMEADTGRAWLALTGDASQRSMLAEAFRAEPSRPVYLLFEPGMDLLPLLAESLALLTPEQRWEVTFSTYFTGLPQGVQCLWRCVPHGAPEAKGARQVPNALVIDLAGMRPERVGAMAAKARRQVVVPPPLAEKEVNWPDQEGDSSGDNAAWQEMSNTNRKAQPLAAPPPVPYTSEHVERQGTSWKKIWFSGLGLGLVIGFIISVGIGHYSGFFRTQQPPQVVEQKEKEIEELKAHIRHQEHTLEERRRKELSDGIIGIYSNSLETVKPWLALAMKMTPKGDKKVAKGDPEPPKPIPQFKEEEKKKSFSPKNPNAETKPGIAEQIKKLERRPGDPFVAADVEKQFEELWAATLDQTKQMEKMQKQYAPKIISYYFSLPTGGATAEYKEPLPKNLIEAPKESKETQAKWHLQLEGFKEKGLGELFELREISTPSSLDIEIVKFEMKEKKREEKAKEPLAKFRVETKGNGPNNNSVPHLVFSWQSNNSEARRLVRNSVLKITELGSKRDFYFGLMQHKQNLPVPLVIDLPKGETSPKGFDFSLNTESYLEKEPFLASIRCEIDSEIRLLQAIQGQENVELKWDKKVTVKFKPIDAAPGKYRLTAHWIGSEKPSKIYIHSVVVCMKIGTRNVEIWRLEAK